MDFKRKFDKKREDVVFFLATLDCFPRFSISLSVVVLVALRWLEGVRVKCETKNSENP